MRELLVIRFSALGDLCVLGWALARLRDQAVGQPLRVTVVTKSAFAPLVAEMRGVDEVIALDGSSWGALRALAGKLRSRSWTAVVDAHNTLRSRTLLVLMGRRPAARLAKDTLGRLVLLQTGRSNPRLKLRMIDRFDALFVAWRDPEQTAPATPPLSHLRGRPGAGAAPDAPAIVALAPGAQWATKRWPEECFAEVLDRLPPGPDARVYLGPREDDWYASSALARVVAASARAEVIRLPDLVAVATSLTAAAALVTNDSGLLHLSEAVGTPVVALYGPTVREFGYFPLLARSRALEESLSCRPCSRNGKRACHRGDLACLRTISPDAVLASLAATMNEGGPA